MKHSYKRCICLGTSGSVSSALSSQLIIPISFVSWVFPKPAHILEDEEKKVSGWKGSLGADVLAQKNKKQGSTFY